MPKLKYVLRGIKIEHQKTSSTRSIKRLPITPNILKQVHSVLANNSSDFDNVMLWAASLLCFFGFLRSGEATIPNSKAYDPSVHMSMSDLSVDNPLDPSTIQVLIKASKTDPFRLGIYIYIGRTGSILCPVTAMFSYLSIRGNSDGMLFQFHDHSPLTKAKFISEFRKVLFQAGIDSSLYSGHSFRIGAASTAAANGVEDSIIQTLGRWKSSAYLAYVKISPQNLAAISCRICSNN